MSSDGSPSQIELSFTSMIPTDNVDKSIPQTKARAFLGDTYKPVFDFDRLKNNLQRVYVTMSDGKWHTAESLRQFGGSETTRRIRDLRGDAWGPLQVDVERIEGGCWKYRIDLYSLTQPIHDKIMSGKPDKE